MNIVYDKSYSQFLNREMEYKIFGEAGLPFLVFPSQDGRFFDFENNGMVESVRSYIEQKKIQLFCVDSNDVNSFSNQQLDHHQRIQNHIAYFNYICQEFYPILKKYNTNPRVITTGCSMGASHSLNFLLKRPDLFAGCIALSGVYDLRYFFQQFQDPLIYEHSPVDYFGKKLDSTTISIFQDRDIILCVGQGAWEKEMIEDTKKMQEILAQKQIPAWIDFWGYDVSHDWYWWQKQLPYFIKYIL